MRAKRSLVLTAALWALLSPTRADAAAPCRPHVKLDNAQFSAVTNLKRYWSATVTADASSCAASSGLFTIRFLRLSESGPDLEFAEPFIWQQGQRTVRIEFWADEAVGEYGLADVAMCPCKGE